MFRKLAKVWLKFFVDAPFGKYEDFLELFIKYNQAQFPLVR